MTKELSVEVWKKLILEVMLEDTSKSWTKEELFDAVELLAIRKGLK